MKQTAVEWLEEQMKTWGDKPRWMRDNIVEQAKEMEKKQIMSAYSKGHIVALLDGLPHSEQYYINTYGK